MLGWSVKLIKRGSRIYVRARKSTPQNISEAFVFEVGAVGSDKMFGRNLADADELVYPSWNTPLNLNGFSCGCAKSIVCITINAKQILKVIAHYRKNPRCKVLGDP